MVTIAGMSGSLSVSGSSLVPGDDDIGIPGGSMISQDAMCWPRYQCAARSQSLVVIVSLYPVHPQILKMS